MKRFRIVIAGFIPALFAVAILVFLFRTDCPATLRGVLPEKGIIRGTTLLLLTLPGNGSDKTIIQVNEEKRASIQTIPISDANMYRSEKIPEQLWKDAEILRQSWCTTPPTFALARATDSQYRLLFQCGCERNPVFAVSPDKLPNAIKQLELLLSTKSQ